MANIHKGTWGTESELNYLSKIGKSHTEVKRRTSKATLLKNYIIASEKRQNWGGINKKEVVERAKYLLAEIEYLLVG